MKPLLLQLQPLVSPASTLAGSGLRLAILHLFDDADVGEGAVLRVRIAHHQRWKDSLIS